MGSDAIYRFEHAKSGRALCRNAACKNQEIKIQKGEDRMGVLATLPNGNQFWAWKHWGCVTPLQIKNIQDNVEGLDLDNDLDILDGWDEIDEEFREKIKQAIRVGHVADGDWRGSPELNRPGMKGINKTRTPKKNLTESAEPEESEASPSKPAAKKKASTKKRKVDPEASDDTEEEPAAKSRKKKVRKKTKVESDLSDDADDEPAPKATKRTKAKSGKTVKEEVEDEVQEPATKKGKSRARTGKTIKKEDDADNEAPAPTTRQNRAGKSKKQPHPEHAEADDQEDADWGLEEKPRRSGAKKVKKEAQDATEPISRSRKKVIKHEEVDIDAEIIQPASTKAKRSRKIKKEPSPEPEADPEVPQPVPPKAKRGGMIKKESSPEPEPAANGETGPADEIAPEPEYPVIPVVDGTADVKVKTANRGRKVKKEEVVDRIETEAPATPARVKKKVGKKGIKAEPTSDEEGYALDAMAETAKLGRVNAPVKKEKKSSKVAIKTEDEDAVDPVPEVDMKKAKKAKGRGKGWKREVE